jgi:hypothetical protein
VLKLKPKGLEIESVEFRPILKELPDFIISKLGSNILFRKQTTQHW